jgi:hypothetical protein
MAEQEQGLMRCGAGAAEGEPSRTQERTTRPGTSRRRVGGLGNRGGEGGGGGGGDCVRIGQPHEGETSSSGTRNCTKAAMNANQPVLCIKDFLIELCKCHHHTIDLLNSLHERIQCLNETIDGVKVGKIIGAPEDDLR